MIITNGKRTLSVAASTIERVIDHLASNPGKTVTEYAVAVEVAEVTINLIIACYLMEMVNAGRIAVSAYGRRPNWYFMAIDRTRVPVRKPNRQVARVSLHGITSKHVRQDCLGLINSYDASAGRRMSPAKRAQARKAHMLRVHHVGSNHQDTIDSNHMTVAEMRTELKGLKEAIQVMAITMTGIKSAA